MSPQRSNTIITPQHVIPQTVSNYMPISSRVVDIINARLAPSTQAKYTAAFSQFCTWCQTQGFDLLHLIAHEPIELDIILCEYLLEVFEDFESIGGSGRSTGEHTLNGLLHYFPEYQIQFPRSRAFLAGWARLKPSISHPPLMWPLVISVALTMLNNNQLEYGIATLLAFDCYLRVSEYSRLSRSQVLLPHDARFSVNTIQSHSNVLYSSNGDTLLWRTDAHTIITLPKSKTGLHQSVTVEDRDIEEILHAWLSVCSGPYVFTFTQSQFRHVFQHTLRLLNLHHVPFSPHSLRHGGASWHFWTKGADALKGILRRGRWVSHTGADSYLQSAPSRLGQYNISPQFVLQGQQWATRYKHAFLHHIRRVGTLPQ